MNQEKKMRCEERIMNLSLAGGVLFVLSEIVMAYVSQSHSMLMDCIFDTADLIMVGPFLVLVPLLYKPVTEKHPYGFSQVESLFLIIKYSILLVVTFQLIYDNVQLIRDGGYQVDAMQVAVFELGMFLGCLIIYLILYSFSKKYSSVIVKTELYGWKLDIIGSLGVAIAFLSQYVLKGSQLSFIIPYIDPVVAIVMALFLIVEPIKVIGKSLKKLVLFAPNEKIMEDIRKKAEEELADCEYSIQFLDVIQTGRKTWVEIYIKSPNDEISIHKLYRIRNRLREQLKESFDQIYVEVIPDLPEERSASID